MCGASTGASRDSSTDVSTGAWDDTEGAVEGVVWGLREESKSEYCGLSGRVLGRLFGCVSNEYCDGDGVTFLDVRDTGRSSRGERLALARVFVDGDEGAGGFLAGGKDVPGNSRGVVALDGFGGAACGFVANCI